MERTLRIAPIADLSTVIPDGQVVALNVGPDGLVYVVVALGKVDYQYEARSGAKFAVTIPIKPQDYRVVALSGDAVVLDVTIANEPFNIHDVQPLGPSELLLVCCRSRYRSRDDYDKNGRVYGYDGQFVREILLGDGIQSLQVTPGGTIWTSFFDEGIFGNFGWHQPVGESGLVAWDASGKSEYEFQPVAGLDSMCDCYALNVESDSSVWCYYYTQFPLVHLQRRKVTAFWNLPLGGSDGFAVSRGLALFRGGYKRRDTYTLLKLGAHEAVETLATLDLFDESGEMLIADRVVGRGESIHLLRGSHLYRLDLSMAAHAIGL